MDAFFLKLFRRIRKEFPRRSKDLRDQCDHFIESLENQNPIDPQSYFQFFDMSSNLKVMKITEISLEGILFLLENNLLDPKSENNGATSLESILHCVTNCSDESDEGVQILILRSILSLISSNQWEVHNSSLLLAVRCCFTMNITQKSASIKSSARTTMTQILNILVQRTQVALAALEDSSASPLPGSPGAADLSPSLSPLKPVTEENEEGGEGEGEGTVDQVIEEEDETGMLSQFSSQPTALRDLFIVFRYLCSQSSQPLDELPATSLSSLSLSPALDSTLQTKMLSLELLMHILQRSSLYSPMFIYAVRNYLVVSLLGNCTAHFPQVVGLALQIFSTLMEQFKDHLKREIEIFVSTIFLKILESENSTYDHKLKVLVVFHSLCSDSSGLVEIFINYDCDLESIDLLKRIVEGFSKVAKNPMLSSNRAAVDFISSSAKKSQQDERNLRLMGLQGLATILHSLVRSAGLADLPLPDTDPAMWTEGRLTMTTPPPKSLKKFDEELGTVDEVDPLDPLTDSMDTDSTELTQVFNSFDQKQKIQEEIETGILKFNQSAKKGLAYMVSHGHLEMTPRAVARFLLQYQDRLDKTVIGDYLGREREYENGFCFHVLHEYVDSMDFANMAFDLAIRHFLGGFRLPGEAQKIDRLMEKFAERYYLQNRNEFASADMAFILAFSTIMLQTNLHNPAIKDDKRMTKEQFVRQNKGISSDGELPDQLLMDIFDRIAAQPISITQDDKLRKSKKDDSFVMFQQTNDRRRKSLFGREREEMMKAGQALIKQKSRASSVFLRNTKTTDETYVKPIFEIVWPPLVVVLSQLLETFDDPDILRLCLDAFQCGIQLGCRLDLSLAKNTFVNALAKFTALDVVKEMQPKNIECIKVLLNVSLYEGDYLGDSWTQILQILSQVARLQMIATGSQTDDKFFSAVESNSSRRLSSISNTVGMVAGMFNGPSRAELSKLVEEANSALVSASINTTIIDQLFINSQTLSTENILQFVQSLCTVSMLEINLDSSMNSLREAATPRIFCLQKLVEVADYNMHIRPRLAWSKIWGLLASHFTLVGMHDNLPLSMYAIDSLRQLSIKFLKKEELSNFNFQRLFLNPFEQIISKSRSTSISDLILNCIDNIVLSCSKNIRSGWRSILSILQIAARDDHHQISRTAFEILDRLLTCYFDLLIFDFIELLNCVLSFVASCHTDLSMRALNLMKLTASKLFGGSVSPALESQNTSSDTFRVSWEKSSAREFMREDTPLLRLCWSLYFGLAQRTSDTRVEVRAAVLKTLDNIILKFSCQFSVLIWSGVFQGILFPLMNIAQSDRSRLPTSAFPAQNPVINRSNNSWIASTASSVFKLWIDTFFVVRVSDPSKADQQLLQPLLVKVEEFVSSEIEILARDALAHYKRLILSFISNDLSSPSKLSFTQCCQSLSRCLRSSLFFNFSELGRLVPLSLRVPPPASASLLWPADCPCEKRRNEKIEENLVRPSLAPALMVVRTTFGTGNVTGVFDTVPPKVCIQLEWSGKLYCPMTSTCILDLPAQEHSKAFTQPWSKLSSCAMSSMALTLQIQKLLLEAWEPFFSQWSADLCFEILASQFQVYAHARSFNENIKLRKSLFEVQFMPFPDDPSRWPHLREQEIQSLSLLLEFSLKLYQRESLSNSMAPSVSQSESWFHSLCICACERYLSVEHSMSVALSSELCDHDQLEAFGSSAVCALRALRSLSTQQFGRCLNWLPPILSQLILSEDNDIRSFVSEIYSVHINPRLIPD